MWLIENHCGPLWIIVAHFVFLWLILAHCGSLRVLAYHLVNSLLNTCLWSWIKAIKIISRKSANVVGLHGLTWLMSVHGSGALLNAFVRCLRALFEWCKLVALTFFTWIKFFHKIVLILFIDFFLGLYQRNLLELEWTVWWYEMNVFILTIN